MDKDKDPIMVNGEEVSASLVEQELQMLHERYACEMSHEEMEQKQAKIESDARENAVERVLLMQQARTEIESICPQEIEARFGALKQQYGGDKEFDRQFDLNDEDAEVIKAEIGDSIRLEKYFDEICRDAPRPDEADLRNYYEVHREEFRTPEMVHVAHILQQPSPDLPVEKLYAELLNVREQLKAGGEFQVLAEKYSHCSDGGHDLGHFARGQMVPAFEEVAFDTKVGEYSDVFQTEFGYHILTVLDRRPEAVCDFEEVRYDIETMLLDARKNEIIGAVADELRAEAEIRNLEIVEESL